MRIISAIEPQKKDLKRVNVYLDGEFAFGVTSILATWLNIGQELTEEQINGLIFDDGLESSYQKALHFLSFRPRSIVEVRKNLAERDIPEILIDETIKHLQSNFLLNDLNFAREWVANRKDFHPRSHSALRMELRQKGISEEIIQKALEEIIDDESLAFLAAQKYKHRLEGLNKLDFRKKLNAFLSRKGFSFSSINPVFIAVWNELHPGSEHGLSINSEDY